MHGNILTNVFLYLFSVLKCIPYLIQTYLCAVIYMNSMIKDGCHKLAAVVLQGRFLIYEVPTIMVKIEFTQ